MKRYKTGKWIRVAERMPTQGEIKKYIILYYYPPELERRYPLIEVVDTDSSCGSRTKTHWMKIDRPGDQCEA